MDLGFNADNRKYKYGKLFGKPWHYGIQLEPDARPHFSITLYPDFLNITFIRAKKRRVLEVFRK